MAEQELTVKPHEVLAGDHLYVGHQFWARIERVTAGNGVTHIWCPAVVLPLRAVTTDRLTIRREVPA